MNKALKKAGFKDYKNISEIVVIEQGDNFETHLFTSGYESELEEVIKQHHLENAKSEQHRQVILNRRSLTVGNIKKILSDKKHVGHHSLPKHSSNYLMKIVVFHPR